MADTTIVAEGHKVAGSADGKQVRLSFAHSGEWVHIAIPAQAVTSIVQDLENSIDASLAVTAIGQEELARSSGARIVGRNVKTYAGRSKQMVLTIELKGRTRSFPVNLSENDVAKLIADLTAD